MMSRVRVLRWGSALVLSGGLMAQVVTTVPVAKGFDLSQAPANVRAHISGTAELALGAAQAHSSQHPLNYFPGSDECQTDIGSNVKVNQNCLNISDPDFQGRAQAQNETSVAVDPNNPQHIVGSYNDYRRGDGNCGVSYSLDGGRSWNDSTAPTGFTRGSAPFGSAPRQYWQAGGDTSVAFDTKGNAYLSCQLFQRGAEVAGNPDLSSAFVVFRSTHNGGASWNFPGRYTTFFQDLTGATEVQPGLAKILEDKALMTVDNHVGSPFQDRIYVTWTEFDLITGSAFIYEVHSDDFGETISPRVLVSKPSTLCPFPGSTTGGCDSNQDSQPFTGPDGALYVVFNNFNTVPTPPVGPARYQVLIAKSSDGGATFGPLQKVSDYFELPDCFTYQHKDFGRACVPEKGPSTNSFFRATNYPSGGVNPRNARQVVVSLGSYINRHSQESNGCVPTGTDPDSGGGLYTGVKTAGACNNKIVISVSNNGGATFTGTTMDVRKLPTASSGQRQNVSDQWFQWLDITRGGRVAVSYYDRQYGDDETTGFSDQSVSAADELASEWSVKRITTSSMPPPTQFNGVFWGDYGSLATVGNTAIGFWSDTRSVDLFICPGTAKPGVPPALCTASASNAARANDQDIFAARVALPGGGEGNNNDNNDGNQ